jgi:putative intracellular protease/amidase
MYTANKPVAVVCHAPAVLLNAKTSDGKNLICNKSITGFSNAEEEAVGLTEIVPFLLEDQLIAKGGQFSKGDDWQPYVITDGNLISGQNPASSYKAAKTLLNQVQ